MALSKTVLLHISKQGVRPSRTYQSPGIPNLVAVDNVPSGVSPSDVAAQYAKLRFDTPRLRVDWREIGGLPAGHVVRVVTSEPGRA